MTNGWIKLHRKIQDCFLWDDKEPHNRRSAWIDLLLLVNHSDKEMSFDGKRITVKAGQRITSVRKLSERWHWSKDRTERFLNLLVDEGMISKESDSRRTLLTVINYEFYQGGCDSNEDSDKDSDKDTHKDTDKPQTRIYKNEKNEKNNIGDQTPYNLVLDLYREICVSFPQVRSLSASRKKSIKARLNTFTLEDFRTVFINAEQSSFLKGKNDRNWFASFDWLLQDRNFTKVLEGQYKDRDKAVTKPKPNTFTDIQKTDYDFAELEKQLLSKPI